MKQLISIVIPAYNEAAGISHFHQQLRKAIPGQYRYELLFVDDGSTDNTLSEINAIQKRDNDVRIISFSRNFGKEAATTAGIIESRGMATIVIDADGQHPVVLLSKFLQKWEEGAQVVIGIRETNQKEGVVKRYGSKLFYKVFNRITSEKIVPSSTDFRLIDAEVRDAFSRLSERSRITRALIDWLGFKKEYITFAANAREFGEASYSTKKLVKLAMNSFVSLTTFPLLVSGYLGLVIMPLSLMLGFFIIIEQYALNDPMSLKITGSASLGIFVVFLVGLILVSQGLLALYISRIYEEAKDRPLYIINPKTSTTTVSANETASLE